MESSQKIKRRAPQIPHREAPPPPYVRLQKKNSRNDLIIFINKLYNYCLGILHKEKESTTDPG